MSNDYSALTPLIAGFTAGVVSTSLLLPLDVIKVRLQVHENRYDNVQHRRQLGTLRVLKGIIRNEGVGGIYQGWTPAVLGSAVSWGGYFYFYEILKRNLVNYKLGTSESTQNQAEILHSGDTFVLACTASSAMVFMTNPLWLVKTRMQLQMKRSQLKYSIKPYKSTVDAFRTIARDEGLLALYKGTGPALLLTSHGGVQFVVYEYLRKHFHYSRAKRIQGDVNLSLNERLELSLGYLVIGAVAKIAASTATYPLQVIKSRMQQRSDAVELTVDGDVKAVKRDYIGMIDSTRKIYQREGFRSFYKGLIPNTVRVIPGAAITFVVYEAVTDWLR